MAFCKSGAGMDVKYLCSWDYRVGEKHDGAFLMRPHASYTCGPGASSAGSPRASSPKPKGQIFNFGAPPCWGNPGCNKDQILPRKPGAIHLNELQVCFGLGVRGWSSIAPPAGRGVWNPAATPGKRQIPTSGLGRQLGKPLLLILCSAECKCICKFESSCWCSAVNWFCFTKPLLFGFKRAKFRVYPALLFAFQGRFCLAASVTYGSA